MNSHPAASGHFASYDEIIANFYYEPFVNNSKNNNIPSKNRFISYNIFNKFNKKEKLFILITAAIFTLLLYPFGNINSISLPFFIFKEVIVVLIGFLILFFIILKKNSIQNSIQNSIKVRNNRNNNNNKDKDKKVLDQNSNFFELGILTPENSQFQDLIIGIGRKKRFEHTMIISPTGGGKTSKYIIPAIRKDSLYKNTSVFAIDIDSPYLYDHVKDYWIKNGKKIIHFDPYNGKSIHFNPLIKRSLECVSDENSLYKINSFHNAEISSKLPRTLDNDDKNKFNYSSNIEAGFEPISDDGLYELVSALFYIDPNDVKGGDMHAHKYYYRRSSDVFYGCLLYLKYKYDTKYFNLITAVSFFEKGNKFIENEIKSYNGEKNIKIKGLFNNFFELPIFERAKIITDILNGLDFLKNENVKNAFKTNIDTVNNNDLFTISDIFTDDTLLIASIPKEKLSSGGSKLMSFVTDLIIKEIYEDRRMRLKDKNLERHKDVYIYLDEFPVLSLNNFDTELANLRKTGTGVCISLQDISFLKNKYGNVSLIDSNIGTHIVMGQAGIDTCEHYSRKMGQKYIFHKEHLLTNPANNNLEGLFNSNMSNYTHNNNGMIGEEGTREVPVASGLYPLMSANEIKNIQTDTVLIYSKYTNPFILKLNDINIT